MFERKSCEMLRACKYLFGYKLTFSENKVTLTSLKCSENILQFKLTPKLALCETEYANNFKSLIDWAIWAIYNVHFRNIYYSIIQLKKTQFTINMFNNI